MLLDSSVSQPMACVVPIKTQMASKSEESLPPLITTSTDFINEAEKKYSSLRKRVF